MNKPIIFSQHAEDQLNDRGAAKDEVGEAIREGEVLPAQKGRLAFRKNFPYNAKWKGKYYTTKQVFPIVVDEKNSFIVITVYVFYFGGKQ